jgi:predicted MPP superfamily phosphohydrolase
VTVNKEKPALIWIIGILGALAALAVWGALERKLRVVRYRLVSKRLSSQARLRLAVVGDLHNAEYPQKQQALIRAILEQRPDGVLMAGDMFDERGQAEGALLLARGLKGRVPCYYVPGNHEYHLREPEKAFRRLADLGCLVLRNRAVMARMGHANLVIAGLDDRLRRRHEPEYDPAAAARTLAEEIGRKPGFRILLSHRPEQVELYDQMDVDLVVCGHAHGGQWRIPGLVNGVFAPGQGLFPRYAGGLYPLKNKSMIVTRGLANHTAVPRIFNPPELTVVELRGADVPPEREG